MESTNKLLPLYILIGDDKLKIRTVLEKLNKRMTEFGDPSLNTSNLDAEVCSGDEIIQSCMQMPFGSDMRLCTVKNAEKLKKVDTETLLEYITNPNPACILVLIYKKLAKSTKIHKQATAISQTCIIDCARPKKWKAWENVIKIARSKNAQIDESAAKILVDLVGEDTIMLASEIDKLSMLNNGNKISADIVLSNVKKSTSAKPWDFTNAFADRNIDLCLSLFKQMPKDSEYMLIGQTCKIVKELICVKDMGKSATNNIIAHELNYDLWRVKNHIKWANNFKKFELVDILTKALNCDKIMKSSSNSTLAFENFIIESLKS